MGHNPGGQSLALRILRTFCRFCRKKKWLTVYPFEDFKIPKSEFVGRYLTEEERAKLLSVNARYSVDYSLNQALSFGLYSLLIDPAVVWQQQTGPFADNGDPLSGLFTSAARLGIGMAAFPFTAGGHVIHRGRSSLAWVYAARHRSHPQYEWAVSHHDPHFGQIPGADQRYEALLQTFRDQTGPLTGTTLAAACRHRPRRR